MRRLVLILALLWPLAAQAVQPDEMLSDPVLESRAQALDEELRCVLCRSESIASSNADWAADARVLVRELIAEGRSDAEVRDFFVARYGDYVLMQPRVGGVNLLLWAAGPLILLLAGIVLVRRRRATPVETAPLTAEERAELDALTRD
ncbi:cytochrome c-type biogenesis protein [Roseobacter sp. HKCCA0434]|uniref:cytochrome c-type biogenesis protein n=1 Tax=Roseobacter sp. HKCCA0434 TaxID=3079297 RepID=UPI0029058F53|nr:cytochrome c-type biogenesis protein [Roseobacter sp. HKCCA0434]